jgi:hypothetical protein
MTQITPTADTRRNKPRRVVSPGTLPVATLIALITVGWEHVYHTVALGLDASLAGHLIHVADGEQPKRERR